MTINLDDLDVKVISDEKWLLVIIEQVFSWPGLGLMTMSAITARDYPVIMGVCLLSAIVVLAANLVTDILYALVDPTIQLD